MYKSSNYPSENCWESSQAPGINLGEDTFGPGRTPTISPGQVAAPGLIWTWIMIHHWISVVFFNEEDHWIPHQWI